MGDPALYESVLNYSVKYLYIQIDLGYRVSIFRGDSVGQTKKKTFQRTCLILNG
jgi:hypothetical protein